VYASSTVALATLEMLVHLDSTVPLPAYRLIEAAIPESLITAVPANALPHNWRNYPAPPELRILGDNWLQSGDSAVLKVPSALVAVEFNYVINPQHPDFPLITTATAVSFPVDARLL
jgi:RES domain-containing protein